MTNPNSKIFADRIAKVLDFLKERKISQYEVEEALNYTSLSKAKNYDRYPQIIIERKTREELFVSILDRYNLIYDEESDVIWQKDSAPETTDKEDTLYYLMYYYAFARETIGRAIVKIKNNKKVVMDYRLDEHWEGSYEVIENYAFILVEKIGGVTPVKKLVCLFTGTKKYGRPILLGTYSTIKRDGFPAAGKMVFERIYDQKLLNEKIKQEPDPRIAYYLKDKVLVSATFTPNTLEDLSTKYKIIARYTGEYYLFYPDHYKNIVKAEMTFFNDSRVNLTINKVTYTGSINPIDNHTIKLEMNDDAGFSDIAENSIVLFMNTSKSRFDPFYCCGGISNAIDSNCNSFSGLIIEREIYDKLPEEESLKILNNLCENIG